MWYAYDDPCPALPWLSSEKIRKFLRASRFVCDCTACQWVRIESTGVRVRLRVGLGLGLLSRAELALGALVTPVTSEPESQFEPVGSK